MSRNSGLGIGVDGHGLVVEVQFDAVVGVPLRAAVGLVRARHGQVGRIARLEVRRELDAVGCAGLLAEVEVVDTRRRRATLEEARVKDVVARGEKVGSSRHQRSNCASSLDLDPSDGTSSRRRSAASLLLMEKICSKDPRAICSRQN